MTQEMAANEVDRDEAIWGRPTLTRLVSMVAMNAPNPAVTSNLFLLMPGISVLRVRSYEEMCLRINKNGGGNKAGAAPATGHPGPSGVLTN